jgi:hypothetical protein
MPTPPYSLIPQPMQKSWIERHPGAKIALGILTLLLLGVLFVGILMTIITTSMRSSDAYKDALASATENSEVRAAIGEPIKPAWLIAGEIKVSGSAGYANLTIPITGSHGQGVIHAVAAKSEGVWRFSFLAVHVQGHTADIDLLPIQPATDSPSH